MSFIALYNNSKSLVADFSWLFFYRSMKLLRIFQRLLSAIAYWAPVAVETPFIPTIAFPFAKLLQNNQLIAFEVVATVLLNWCQKWFDFIPNPPLNILAMIENVLSYHDRELFQVCLLLLDADSVRHMELSPPVGSLMSSMVSYWQNLWGL